jgi:hypothetical protein
LLNINLMLTVAGTGTRTGQDSRDEIRRKLRRLQQNTSMQNTDFAEDDIVEAIVLEERKATGSSSAQSCARDGQETEQSELNDKIASAIFDMCRDGDGLISFEQFWRWWSLEFVGDDTVDSAFGRLNAVFQPRAQMRFHKRKRREKVHALFKE